jgi:hypothetical protein
MNGGEGMANKRQRKKNKGNENIKRLQSVGINKKKAAKVKNKPQIVQSIFKQRNKEIKADNRKRIANERSKLIQGLGLKVKDHASKRYLSEEHWNEWYKKEQKKIKHREAQKRYRERKKEKEKAIAGGHKVLILWKDVTENVDKEWLHGVIEGYKDLKQKDLLNTAQGWRKMTFGEIGQYRILTLPPEDYHRTMEMYGVDELGFYRVYFGTGANYKHLLQIINGMFLGLYQSSEKGDFIRSLVRAFEKVNPPVADRLRKDFNVRKRG